MTRLVLALAALALLGWALARAARDPEPVVEDYPLPPVDPRTHEPWPQHGTRLDEERLARALRAVHGDPSDFVWNAAALTKAYREDSDAQ